MNSYSSDSPPVPPIKSNLIKQKSGHLLGAEDWRATLLREFRSFGNDNPQINCSVAAEDLLTTIVRESSL